MTVLFDRIYKVRVGTLDVSHLDVAFNIKRSLKGEPNKLDLTVWNLSRDNLNSIREAGELDVEVRAGYADQQEPPLLFRGLARREVFAYTEKTETVLKLKARDGSGSRRSRINRSYNTETPVRTVLGDLADAMGVGRGNLQDFENDPFSASGNSSLPQGFVAVGQAWVNFDRLVRSQGNRWSIQNGVIQILPQRTARLTPATLIKSSTGMIGSPQRDKSNKVTVEVLLQPNLEPGKIVRVESTFINGDYEIQETNYKGSTVGTNSDWVARLVLKPL